VGWEAPQCGPRVGFLGGLDWLGVTGGGRGGEGEGGGGGGVGGRRAGGAGGGQDGLYVGFLGCVVGWVGAGRADVGGVVGAGRPDGEVGQAMPVGLSCSRLFAGACSGEGGRKCPVGGSRLWLGSRVGCGWGHVGGVGGGGRGGGRFAVRGGVGGWPPGELLFVEVGFGGLRGSRWGRGAWPRVRRGLAWGGVAGWAGTVGVGAAGGLWALGVPVGCLGFGLGPGEVGCVWAACGCVVCSGGGGVVGGWGGRGGGVGGLYKPAQKKAGIEYSHSKTKCLFSHLSKLILMSYCPGRLWESKKVLE